ncbi:MAG TPA: hypothetical protein VL179_00430 [Mycobacterium sp.]|nr:hypothetical protein [Mycobacterium sp.]
MSDGEHLSRSARRLAAVLEPVAGQVYFAPECHREYGRLGFAPSPATLDSGVQLPDGAAYFTSRGSCLGQVPGELVAAAFAVFNPQVVIPAVRLGWTHCDAATIASARTRGATAQLVRILGERPDGLDRATSLLQRTAAPLRPEGRPLYAGLLSLDLPADPMGAMWRSADILREFRGDAHTASWTSAGFDATEIGLLTELYRGVPARSQIRTRAWSDAQLDAAEDRLRSRGLLDGTGLTEKGRAARDAVEVATDRQCGPAVEALGDQLTELVDLLEPWGAAIRAAGGFPPS